MSLSTPNLNITLVPTYSSKSVGIADISQYPTGYYITNPTIEFTIPGFKKVALPFTTSSINVYNGNNLGVCNVTDINYLSPLPDGIYTVRFSISPNNTTYVEKNFMRTEIIECKYSKAFLKLDITQCDNEIKKYKKDKLNKIRLFIDGSIASANDCDLNTSYKLYQKADEMLKKFSDGECDCNHI